MSSKKLRSTYYTLELRGWRNRFLKEVTKWAEKIRELVASHQSSFSWLHIAALRKALRRTGHLSLLNQCPISLPSRGSSLDNYCNGSLRHRSAKPMALWPFQSHRWMASSSYYSSLSAAGALKHSWPIIHSVMAVAHLLVLWILLISSFQTNGLSRSFDVIHTQLTPRTPC